MSNLAVKVFMRHERPTVTPVANRTEARQLFQAHVDDLACTAVYVYAGETIIASWDSSSEYLMAIGDIELDDEGRLDGELYGDHALYDEVQP